MTLEIVWSPLALARLQEIRAYVARDQPEAAARLATRIVALVEALKDHPYLGRTGSEPGVRELVVGGLPTWFSIGHNRDELPLLQFGTARSLDSGGLDALGMVCETPPEWLKTTTFGSAQPPAS